MKRNPTAAIATLVRWREFQESRASDVYRQCAIEAETAHTKLTEAQASVDGAQRHRLDLLQALRLDLTRLQITAQFEDVARLKANEREAALKAAQQRQDDARAVHVGARAQTRVAETRHARVAATEFERSEKALFDWMADLRVSAKGKA